MVIQIKNGNILDATENIIVHQVNGLGIMGGGLAKQIRNKYPKVYKSYRKFAKAHKNPTDLLGINLMLSPDGKQIDRYEPNPPAHIISNVFGQAYIGTSEKQTSESALGEALYDVALYARLHKLSIAIPYGIGCGLGGGDWNEVKRIIDRVFMDCDVVIYKL